MLTKKDWTLITLALADGRALTPVQLQKAVFLLWKKLPPSIIPEDFYNFVPYNYGPFDPKIYTDARAHAHSGLVNIEQDPTYGYALYSASTIGMRQGEEMAQDIPPLQRAYIKTILDFVTRLSFGQLVSAIYNAYPEYQVNSIFQSDPK